MPDIARPARSPVRVVSDQENLDGPAAGNLGAERCGVEAGCDAVVRHPDSSEARKFVSKGTRPPRLPLTISQIRRKRPRPHRNPIYQQPDLLDRMRLPKSSVLRFRIDFTQNQNIGSVDHWSSASRRSVVFSAQEKFPRVAPDVVVAYFVEIWTRPSVSEGYNCRRENNSHESKPIFFEAPG